MKTAVYTLAKYLGLFAVSRYLTRHRMRLLAYHGIWLGPGHYGNHLYMSAGKFARRMAYLANSGYRVLPYGELVSQTESAGLARCPVAITIDDGWYGTYLHMLPVLESHEMPATIYVTSYNAVKQTPVYEVLINYMVSMTDTEQLPTQSLGIPGMPPSVNLSDETARQGFLDQYLEYAQRHCDEAARQELGGKLGRLVGIDYSQYAADKVFHLMSQAQIQDADSRGFDIQLHTHRHRAYHDGQSCLAQEIADNREVLAPLVKSELRHFCYPSGEYDAGMWPVLEASEVETATTTRPGLAHPGDCRYTLPRILDGELVSDIEFEAELAGFCELLRMVKRAVGRQ